jgi:hypothetical protein
MNPRIRLRRKGAVALAERDSRQPLIDRACCSSARERRHAQIWAWRKTVGGFQEVHVENSIEPEPERSIPWLTGFLLASQAAASLKQTTRARLK